MVTVSHPTGEGRSQRPPASHSKDNPHSRVSAGSSNQTEPHELTSRTFKPRVADIHHDQRTSPSSLPVMDGSSWLDLVG